MAHEENKEKNRLQQYEQLISTLPFCNESKWNVPLSYYQSFWYPTFLLPYVLDFCNEFKTRDTDILLVSVPKSGTTWLKALVFATVNRKDHNPFGPDHPLLHSNPHDCIPFIDLIYSEGKGPMLEEESMMRPRLLSMHLPYSNLPELAKSSKSKLKIIYICRDPKDLLVSTWHFFNNWTGTTNNADSLEDVCEMFCKGVSPSGPVWDHVLGYWKESLSKPEKVLFLKYEDLKEDPMENLKRLAEFVGYPFSEMEENEGVVEKIVKLCSFENLTSLEVNRNGVLVSNESAIDGPRINYSAYFRKGKVGDWRNYLSPKMAQRLDAITSEKLSGSGLSFQSI